MSNKFYANAGHFYAPHIMPVLLNASFTVDSTNGAGITGLLGPGIANVFMHTSTTPAVGNRGITNPNPAVGIIVVQLGDAYYSFLGAGGMVQSPNTGSALTSVTANVTYVINVLGTTTTAQWVAKGLPVGITPAVGVAFVASATGALGGTGSVKVQGVSGSIGFEVIGNPSVSLAPLGNLSPVPSVGGQIIMQSLGATDASTTTLIPKALADGSLVKLWFYLGNSSASAGAAG